MRLKTCQDQERSTRRVTLRGRAGFSVVEVMVVVVVISALSGIVLQPLAKHHGTMALAAAVQEFAGAHQSTRSSALRTGQTAELHIDATQRTFWIETQDLRTGVRDTIGTVRTINPSITVTTSTSLLCFDARGLPSTKTVGSGAICEDPASTVVFSNGSVSDTLQFTQLGRVSRASVETGGEEEEDDDDD